MPDSDLEFSSPRALPRSWLFAGVAVWVVALTLGIGMLAAYEFGAEAAAVAPSASPAKAPLEPDGVSPTFGLSVHPQCTCSPRYGGRAILTFTS